MGFPGNKGGEIQQLWGSMKGSWEGCIKSEREALVGDIVINSKETRNLGDGDKAGVVQVRWVNVENRRFRDVERRERISV